MSLLLNRGAVAGRARRGSAPTGSGPTGSEPATAGPAIPAQRRARSRWPGKLEHDDGETDGRQPRSERAHGAAERRYVRRLVLADSVAGIAAVTAAYVATIGTEVHGGYVLLSVCACVLWLACVETARGYEPRFLYAGTEEHRRVLRAALTMAAVGILGAYALSLTLPRTYPVVLAAVAFTTSGVLRLGLRLALQRRRRAGTGWMTRVLVAGHEDDVRDVVRELTRSAAHGYDVVGMCVVEPAATGTYEVPVAAGVPVSAGAEVIAEAAAGVDADAVVVLPCHHLGPAALRRLAWQLERSETQMLVAPGLLDVARSRATLSSVGDLSLVHVEHAELTGSRRLVKEAFDRAAAALGLLVLAPVLALLMLAIRLDSAGPVVFRQERVGRGDRTFTLLKLRTMVVDAESRLDHLASHNEADAVLFKIRHDPRVTRIGRFLRKYSLDELPQLANVLLGHMSLVGPRPPLPAEVEEYDHDVRRKLAVKPGITGLWQVSGRSDLPWEEAVRLDLRYVENWSLGMDLAILWRTGRAVLAHEGAY